MLDESLRRYWGAQIARERVEEARERGRTFHSEPTERPALERSRWLGLQVRSLLALVAVAEEGSFVAAARRLGYSRSTISHQIAQLEAALGASLVVRGSGLRSVVVTREGGIVVAHGRVVLRLLANAEAQLGELERGELRRTARRPLRLEPDARPAT